VNPVEVSTCSCTRTLTFEGRKKIWIGSHGDYDKLIKSL
jgi:hypothetical protein